MNKYDMKAIMARTWALARLGVQTFGGKVSEYIAISMKMAWAEAKAQGSVDEKIKKCIEAYGLVIIKAGKNKGRVQISKTWEIDKHPEDKQFLKENLQAVISAVEAKEAEERRAFEERQAKIEAIEGLTEIRRAEADLASWHENFRRSFSGECGGFGVKEQPKYDLKEMYAKYPRAVAFLTAKSYADAHHYAKSDAGKKAMEKIINGEDYTSAIAEMEKAWSDYCNRID